VSAELRFPEGSCRWRFDYAGTLCCFPLNWVQPGEGLGLFIDLFRQNNSTAKVCELHKLMLNFLQPLTPLSMSELNTCFVPAVTPILLIRLLNVSDLHPETPNLVPKNP
jgi:hypothetical protein